MKKAVLFDLYGTLIDILTDEGDVSVYETLSRYLRYHMVDIAPWQLKEEYFGGIKRSLRQSSEAYPEVDVAAVFSDIMQRYGNRSSTEDRIADVAMLFRSLTIRRFGVFPGLYDALAALSKNYKLALISDAQWVFAEPEIAMLGLDCFFETRILSSRLGYKKPDERLFLQAVEQLGVAPAESVYIGDTPSKDLVGAKRAGMQCIVFRTACSDFEGYVPDRCFDDYDELEKIIEEME
ncbi:MAG: HAD family hydrolase [Nitrospirota bacterium]